MNCPQLPEDYVEIRRIDLQKNKKEALLVNGLSLLISVLMVIPAIFIAPIFDLFTFGGEDTDIFLSSMLKPLCLCAGSILYLVLHEAIHGIFMYHFSKTKPRFGFTGLYAFAASDYYYDKKSYFIIGLSPVVIWGVVLAVIQCFVPMDWFWVVYFIQICNIGGAAGDIYVTWVMLHLPKDVLTWDDGTGMTVYSKKQTD
ncbi:MAG: DUF3267 domain-containing protein [Oscillospiraceae bacterium]|nr:DUF3267 domain-containing protein [Oscillospiraceae bacterium]